MSTKKKLDSLLSQQAARGFPHSAISSRIRAGSSIEEATLSLFQPDILLPAQYVATLKRRDHLEPEKKLMLAVLEDATWCFQKCLLAPDRRRKSLFREAEEWIMAEDAVRLFSFGSICEVLGLNPKYVREGLIDWKEKALAGRVRAKVYRLTRVGERKKRRADEPRTKEHKFLKAAGY